MTDNCAECGVALKPEDEDSWCRACYAERVRVVLGALKTVIDKHETKQ
jgi:Zn finger protein HypA/HybF involved in hydrogenase expression